MTDYGQPRKNPTWDPGGFLTLLVLACVVGGAVLLLVRWIWSLAQTAL